MVDNFLHNIFSSQIKFEGANQFDKFSKIFVDLYRIEIFKDGLDFILSITHKKDINFQVKIIKDWDTNLGCYITEQEKIFNKLLGNLTKTKKTIILRQLTHNLLAHEMTHAVEFESRVDLTQEFRQAINIDLSQKGIALINLEAEIKRLMIDSLKSYKPDQHLSELLARFFELLSISKDVRGYGDFTTKDVMYYFVNSTNYIKRILNPKLKNLVDVNIANKMSNTYIDNLQKNKLESKFQDKVESFFKYDNKINPQKKSWSGNIKSNQRWSADLNKEIFKKKIDNN